MAQQNASDTIARVQASPLSGIRPGYVPIPNMTVTSTIASTGSGAITLTAAQLLGGLIIVDCQDAQNAAFPTAALLMEAIPGPSGSDQSMGACGFQFDIRNSGDSTLTVVVGTGVTISGTATLATATGKRFVAVITDAAIGSEAYTVYSLGAYTF